jgi:hypothetical protein
MYLGPQDYGIIVEKKIFGQDSFQSVQDRLYKIYEMQELQFV